jgi:PAS domain S-box-containing protein/putative nucleotidyltransferase with HDIG domain
MANVMAALILHEPASPERKGILHRWMDQQVPSWLVAGLSGILFLAIFAFRVSGVIAGDVPNAGDATLVLFVIPVAICAMEFGLRGGLAAATFALGLAAGSDVTTQQGIGVFGIATETTAFLIVGGVLGKFVDGRRELEAKVERHFALSLDLFGTATFSGFFEEVNPAWEETLGYSSAQLISRPILDFIHPEDQELTEAWTERMVGGAESASYRNRFQRADGEYRWLQWSIRPFAEEQRLYMTARDITSQQQAEHALQNQSDILERTVRERTEELEISRLETLQRLAVAAEYRDDSTYQHTERVGRAAAFVARGVGLAEADVALLRRAAPLHDIGKVGIPDHILLKPGKLNDEEWKLMKQHTEMGARILGEGSFPVLRMAQEISLTHHERWDGAGYPNGLAGEEIPMVGRILAVVDVFDALTHERPYKRAWSVRESLDEIAACSGTQFDPRVVDAFMMLDHSALLADVVSSELDSPALAPKSSYVKDLPPPPLWDDGVAVQPDLVPALS